MKHLLIIATLLCSLTFAQQPAQDIYSYQPKSITGEPVDLSDYKGKALLIVNVASQCGATDQYRGLQILHTALEKEGFAVLAFPTNQFGGQEPGTDEEIMTFCQETYDVTFPMFAKTDVKGPKAEPLFKYLATAGNPDTVGEPRWNFEKFLISKEGKLLRRFSTSTAPSNKAFQNAILDALEIE
ncbi:MAG: glutathione peroxidase [Verrucomicrobiota bacterium]